MRIVHQLLPGMTQKQKEKFFLWKHQITFQILLWRGHASSEVLKPGYQKMPSKGGKAHPNRKSQTHRCHELPRTSVLSKRCGMSRAEWHIDKPHGLEAICRRSHLEHRLCIVSSRRDTGLFWLGEVKAYMSLIHTVLRQKRPPPSWNLVLVSATTPAKNSFRKNSSHWKIIVSQKGFNT